MTKKALVVAAILAAVLAVASIFSARHSTSVNQVASTSVAAPTAGSVAASPGASPGGVGGSMAPARAEPTVGSMASSPSVDDTKRKAAGAVPSAFDSLLSAPSRQQAGMIDLDKTRRIIRDYHTLMGENPVGTNAEIMKALMGGNPRQATVGPAEGQNLNAKGELVDSWGTPYFFHQLSGDHMEIHSAGPDKIMGTDDDLILK